jgi:hypothetical protein
VKTSNVVPSEAAQIILEKFSKKEEQSANLGRLMPLDFLAKPHLENFKVLCEQAVKPMFENNPGCTWCLTFKVRFCLINREGDS